MTYYLPNQEKYYSTITPINDNYSTNHSLVPVKQEMEISYSKEIPKKGEIRVIEPPQIISSNYNNSMSNFMAPESLYIREEGRTSQINVDISRTIINKTYITNNNDNRKVEVGSPDNDSTNTLQQLLR